MRLTFTILFFIIFSEISFAQDYERVDDLVENYPTNFKDPNELADKISEDFTSQMDQVRAVYDWIVYNVAYDRKEGNGSGISYYSKKDLKQKEIIYQTKRSKHVISKKKAVCAGYSILFKELCDQLGIECIVVSGASRTQISDIYRTWYSDHAWNLVTIDNNKYLIDATWGAGSVSGDTFNRDPDHTYFFTDPNHFIKNHYPENYKNTLLTKKVTKKKFSRAPLIHSASFANFKLLNPKNDGVLRLNSSVEFSFKTSVSVSWIAYSVDNTHYQVESFSHENDELNFTIDLNGKRGRDLTVFINGIAIVGYQIRK